MCGGRRFVRRDLPVDDPAFGQAFPCPSCQPQFAREQARAAMSELVRDATFAESDWRREGLKALTGQDLATWMGAWKAAYQLAIGESPSPWLVLQGDYGVGKSHLAACFLNKRLESDSLPMPEWVNVRDLMALIKSGIADDTERQITARFRAMPSLVLDDVGTETGTDYENGKLYDVLNHRYEERLETVITTNGVRDARLRDRLDDVGNHLVSKHVLNFASYRSGRVR